MPDGTAQHQGEQGKPAVEPTIEDYFSEDRSFPPSEQFVSQAVMTDPAVYGRAEADWRGFWAEQAEERGQELRAHVAEKIVPIARPKTVIFTDELPKTRSGKIMRRLLRDVAEGRVLGDTTTLADPAVVEEIRRLAASAPTDE
jgi:acyl-CoA synthetase (AMP-forming)/AMP-acid ligase II